VARLDEVASADRSKNERFARRHVHPTRTIIAVLPFLNALGSLGYSLRTGLPPACWVSGSKWRRLGVNQHSVDSHGGIEVGDVPGEGERVPTGEDEGAAFMLEAEAVQEPTRPE